MRLLATITLTLLIGLPGVAPALVEAAGPEGAPLDAARIIKIKAVSGPHGEEHVTVSGLDGEAHHMTHPFLRARGYLGVSMLDMTLELRAHFGAPEDSGVLISRVDADSPAARAGLLVGDVLTAVDGEPIASRHGLMRLIVHREADEVVALEVIRDGRRQVLEATLDERPRPQIDLAPMLWDAEGEELEIRMPDGFDLESVIEIDEESLSALRERLDSPGLRKHLRSFGERHETLEERLREMETKLRELEAELEKERE